MQLTHCLQCYGMGSYCDGGLTISSDPERMQKEASRMREATKKCYACNGYGKLKVVPLTDEEIEEIKNKKDDKQLSLPFNTF